MQAWDDFLALQEIELGVETVQKWLRTLKVVHFDARNLYLEAQDSFQMLWFEEHLRQCVDAKLVNKNNRPIKVHLTIAEESLPKKAGHKGSKKKLSGIALAPPPFELTFDLPTPQCTLYHFVPTEGTLLAHKLFCEVALYDVDACQVIADARPKLTAFNPIYLYGPSGIGKTHLLMAMTHALREHGLNAVYVRAETFTEHVVSAIRAGEMRKFREAYRHADALLVDDVHIFARKGATQEEFFHTFNTLHLGNKQLILSANCSPQELELVEPRLVSRFEWGIVLPIDRPNEEELKEIVQTKARALNFPLNGKVISFLLEAFHGHPKALVQAIEALILRRHMNVEGTAGIAPAALTVSTTRQLLQDLIAEGNKKVLTPDKLIQVVADYFGIRVEDILGKAQTRECTLPRQIAMFLYRTKLNMPYMKIGDAMSRDHSTVMTSVRQIQKSLKEINDPINGTLNAINKKLLE